jgi:glycosyltransferase involved in cell wall biosynthesis
MIENVKSKYISGDVLCIVPAMNEATVIEVTISELVGLGYHVLCIDDGSDDPTGAIAESAGAYVVRHSVNLGQGASLQTGFDIALKGHFDVKFVATFDADGQHSVHSLADMLTCFDENPDLEIVLGSRFLQKDNSVPFQKRVVLKFAAYLARFTYGLRVTDRHNGLRLLRLSAVEKIDLKVLGYGHADEFLKLIKRQKISYCESPVEITYSDYSKSKGQPLINSFRVVFDRMFQ